MSYYILKNSIKEHDQQHSQVQIEQHDQDNDKHPSQQQIQLNDQIQIQQQGQLLDQDQLQDQNQQLTETDSNIINVENSDGSKIGVVYDDKVQKPNYKVYYRAFFLFSTTDILLLFDHVILLRVTTKYSRFLYTLLNEKFFKILLFFLPIF